MGNGKNAGKERRGKRGEGLVRLGRLFPGADRGWTTPASCRYA